MSLSRNFNFYFYDYETFGQHPARDRPAQFAGIRTDPDFNLIGPPTVIYCQPPSEYLPDPQAVLITGITPQQAMSEGLTEVEFAHTVHRELSQPNSCILGYNSIRFDDEVTRHLFYRNFYDPYGYSWQQGNSRWDLLDVARACYALRPSGIKWPLDEQGMPSFKLQHLCHANEIEHTQAHDAMSDVYATIGLAKRIRQAQPRLFEYLLQHRGKHQLASLIDLIELKPLVHVSGMFGARRGNTSWIAPLAWHPENQNAVIACDLAGNIESLLTQSPDDLHRCLYTKREALTPPEIPVPLKLIHLNKCPVLAPANVLLPENAKRLQIDRAHCLKNREILQAAPQVREKILAIFKYQQRQKSALASVIDIDARLYDGFFSMADRSWIDSVHKIPPEQLATLATSFQDERLAPLLFRFRAHNFPQTLAPNEQQQWMLHCQQLLASKKADYFQQVTLLKQTYADHPLQYSLLQALLDYANKLFSNHQLDTVL